VTSGGASYQPTPTARDTTVAAGDTLRLPVAYTIASGSIAVVVSGLPGGAAGSITVTGPGGYTQSLTATTPTVRINLEGNELPHSPGFKAKAGAQYQAALGTGDWMATFRVDATWQDAYYAREYNTPTDRIDAWGVIDLQFRLENDPMGLGARLFVKNLTDDDNITNIIIEDALIGRYRNVRLLEPRTYGVILQKRF
jgi:outer membrane receptor protein involved in Fe transport